MAYGIKIDGVEFSKRALASRPDHAALLGRIVTTWSLVESAITGLLGLMMHDNHRAALAILDSFKTNNARVEAVRRIGKEVIDTSLRIEFDTLMKDVLSYAKERNAIAHGLWGVHENNPASIFRMPSTALSRYIVETPHMKNINVDEMLGSFKAEMSEFTVADLQRIEQMGQKILRRIMMATTQNAYSRVHASLQ